MYDKIRLLAAEQAARSDYRFRVGAVIYLSNGRIIGYGFNKPNKTHPKANTPYKTIHAEFAAILKAASTHPPEALHRANIYVHRIRRDGLVGLSKPCVYCTWAIKQAGIENVYWSVDEKA